MGEAGREVASLKSYIVTSLKFGAVEPLSALPNANAASRCLIFIADLTIHERSSTLGETLIHNVTL